MADVDFRLNQPRWRLKSLATGLRIYLRSPTKGEAKALASEIYGLPRWKAKRVAG